MIKEFNLKMFSFMARKPWTIFLRRKNASHGFILVRYSTFWCYGRNMSLISFFFFDIISQKFNGQTFFYALGAYLCFLVNICWIWKFVNPFLCYFQELDLADDVLNRLQTVGLRFCGTADQALPRLRGALPAGILLLIYFTFYLLLQLFVLWIASNQTGKLCLIITADKCTREALDEVSELFNYLRVWKIERCVFLDALMPPTEYYHRKLYFQVIKPVLNSYGNSYLSDWTS